MSSSDAALPVNAVVGTLLATFLLTITLAFLSSTSSSLSSFPLVGKEAGGYEKRRKMYFAMATKLYEEGYQKVSIHFKSSIWRITGADGDIVMIPLHHCDDLRKMPDDTVNNVPLLEALCETRWTDYHPINPLLLNVIKSNLTPSLAKVAVTLSGHIQRTVLDSLGSCTEWTEVVLYDKLLNMVAIISGRIFIGPELCHKKEYLEASTMFVIDLFTTAAKVKRWPKFLRFIGKHYIPEIKKLAEHRRRAAQVLVPVIEERKRLNTEGTEAPEDMLQWFIAKSSKFSMDSNEQLAETQLSLSVVAIHTTTMAATHTLYDIAARCPDIIPALRTEIKSVLAANENEWTTSALFQMKLLDSVMRESQRFNPASLISFLRTITKPVTLKDGTYLPTGTNIAVPMVGPLQDDSHYTDPNLFDPYRFVSIRDEMRSDPLQYANKEQYQFVSLTKENMAFGFGRHACPGRFFAATEIKMLLARVLLEYDIRMPDGVQHRYENIVRGDMIEPDHTKTMMVRKATAPKE
ncbi:Cytochrome P450 monooxygenase ATR2 [Colletotrichum siamense]|uniref:Cytochrome P450 monooxygenase ATR2 n=1 Tax=Colletotrichum siamense TaxID=690259 RepID=UPI0018722A90|nr:Cytochrome P450 monooxygenase ATR2 [Colletotrichum siamense]KAF5505675.1 Cytochrome P450 monooxygenase ATR2 [Colletotrichum siamense]